MVGIHKEMNVDMNAETYDERKRYERKLKLILSQVPTKVAEDVRKAHRHPFCKILLVLSWGTRHELNVVIFFDDLSLRESDHYLGAGQGETPGQTMQSHNLPKSCSELTGGGVKPELKCQFESNIPCLKRFLAED